MPKMVGFNSIQKESMALEYICKDIAARLDMEEWRASFFSSLDAYLKKMFTYRNVDICCIDVVPEGAIEAAKKTRSRFRKVMMLLIAEPHISPIRYLTPNIMASSLLLRPYSKEQAVDALKELLKRLQAIDDEAEESAANVFILETKKARLRIPYNNIYYFEARERKIHLCTGDARQYSFYHTLEGLSKTLPGQFLRCHKGFIVNTMKIEKIAFAENMIYLLGDYGVPVSRSYKGIIKELER